MSAAGGSVRWVAESRGVAACAGRLAAWAPPIAAFAVLCGAAPGCGDKPVASTPPTKSAPLEAAPEHALVVGKAPPANGVFVSIVTLEPGAPRDFPVPTEPKVMDQFGLGFSPGLLLARKGQPVEFKNSEDVLHNVRVIHSDTRSPEFNVSPAPFHSYVHTFERPGFYAVSCDIHPAMSADVFITSTPYASVADKDGRFTLSDVSPGSYRLTVYHGARRMERVVEIVGPRTELIVDRDQK